MNRTPVNSKILQQRHENVYRDFFAICELVASASNSFLWTGELAGFYEGLTLSQKLPFKTYVGLEKTYTQTVKVNDQYLAYNLNRDCFEPTPIDSYLKQNIEQFLQTYFLNKNNFTGYTVHILAEIPLGHSLGSNGAIAGASAILVADNDKFNHRLSIARELLGLSQAGNSSGVSAYMSLVDCQGPILFKPSTKTYFASPIQSIFHSSTKIVWPIDFGLIYSGGGANAASVILANEQTIKELNRTGDNLASMIGQKLTIKVKETYVNMLNLITVMVTSTMGELFRQGSQNNLLEQLFNSLNQYQNLLHTLRLSNGTSDLIYGKIHQLATKQVNEVGSGVKVSGIGKGGSMLFALPFNCHREGILDLVKLLTKQHNQEISLDYASWLDGIGGEPGRLEQDLDRKLYSNFIRQDSIELRTFRLGVEAVALITNERINSVASAYDLWLDQTTNKILIGGLPVTSREIPSQKAIVTILTKLINSDNHTISNRAIESVYGQSRYDLQGKVTIPLVQLIKARTGRQLQLSISGGVYDDYNLSIELSNVSIALVTKRQ